MWGGYDEDEMDRFREDDSEEDEEDEAEEDVMSQEGEDADDIMDEEPNAYFPPAARHKDLKGSIATLFLNCEAPGSFAFAEEVSHVIPTPGLFVDGIGWISTPLSEPTAKALLEKGKPVSSGSNPSKSKSSKTAKSAPSQKAVFIDSKQLRIRNPDFTHLVDSKILDEAHKNLGCGDAKLRADVSQLLVIPEGAEMPFPKSSKAQSVAFLIFCLPSDFQGGEIVVSHGGKQKILWQDPKLQLFQGRVCGFFNHADVQTSIRPVKKGYRLLLVFELIQTSPGTLVSPVGSQMRLEEPIALLKDWIHLFKENESDERDVIIIPLQDQQNLRNLSIASLSAANAASFQRAVAVQNRLPHMKVFLANVEYIEQYFQYSYSKWGKAPSPDWHRLDSKWGNIAQLVDANGQEMPPGYIAQRFINASNIRPRGFKLSPQATPAQNRTYKLPEENGKDETYHVLSLILTTENEVASLSAADIMRKLSEKVDQRWAQAVVDEDAEEDAELVKLMQTLVSKRMEPSIWYGTAQLLGKIAGRPNKNNPEEPDLFAEASSARVCAGTLFASIAAQLDQVGYKQDWVAPARKVVSEWIESFGESFIATDTAVKAFRVYDRHMYYLSEDTRASPMVALFMDLATERCKAKQTTWGPQMPITYAIMGQMLKRVLNVAFEEGLSSMTGPRVLDLVNYFTALAVSSPDDSTALDAAVHRFVKWCLPNQGDLFFSTMNRFLPNLKLFLYKSLASEAWPSLPKIIDEAARLVAGPEPVTQGIFSLNDQIDCTCTYCAVSNKFFKDANKLEYVIAVAKTKAPHLRARAKKIVEVETLAEDKLKFTKKFPQHTENLKRHAKGLALASRIRQLDDSSGVAEPAAKRQKVQ